MDVTHAGTAPLTDEEIAATGRRLRALRGQLDAGELSSQEYGEQVRSVLERRRHAVPGYSPERRRSVPAVVHEDR